MKRSEKKQVTREALISTALALFARNGYEESTVAQIAREAGVAKGTFFNYFQTKEDVLVQVIEGQLHLAKEQLIALAGSSAPLAPGVSEIMVSMVDRLPYTPALIRAMFRSSLAGAESADGFVGPALALVQALVPVFAAGQDRAEFREEIPAERLAFLAVQTYFGALWAWSMVPGDDSLGSVVAFTFDAFFRGVDR